MVPETRSERLDTIEFLLGQHALTSKELAHECGVSDDTILRDLDRLHEAGARISKNGTRYRLDKRRPLANVDISLDGVLVVYLALRLLARHSSTYNPHVIATLRQLARVLEHSAPPLSQQIARTVAAMETRPPHPTAVTALEALLRGWTEGKRVRIAYQSYQATAPQVRTIAPYVIEPSGISGAVYVIGHDSLRDDIRTFRIDRIHSATLTHEPYTIPARFDPQRMLAAAWDVMWDDQQAVESVTLHIAPGLVRLIKERTWHPAQQLADLPDGACLLTVPVQVNREFIAWVLQWGADVTVVSPPAVREQIAEKIHCLAAHYATSAGEKGSGA